MPHVKRLSNKLANFSACPITEAFPTPWTPQRASRDNLGEVAPWHKTINHRSLGQGLLGIINVTARAQRGQIRPCDSCMNQIHDFAENNYRTK